MTATSFIDRIRQRMEAGKTGVYAGARMPKPVGPAPRSRNVIKNTNMWDTRVYRTSRQTPLIDGLVNDLSNGDEHKGGTRAEFEPAPELIEGVFHTFYKANPLLEDKRRLDRDLYPVRKILEEMQGNPKLKELQEFTVGDPMMTTVAIDAMGEQMREILSRIPPPPPPPQPKPKKQKKQEKKPGGQPGGDDQGEGDEPLDGQGPGGHPGGGQGEQEGDGGEGGGQPQPGQGQPEESENESGEEGAPDDFEDEELVDEEGDGEFDPDSEDAENQAEAEWEAAYDEALADLDLDRMANKMLEAAEQEASELDGLRKGIGLEDGEWASMSPEVRMKMAERLRTDEMKALSQVIGQMKRFALGVKATRVNDVPHEAYDVETGNILPRLLKAQFALLGHPDTKYEFYRRYYDSELLQFKMRGTEEVGKGPIVIAIDKSGSMQGAPFRWAMGVAEALRRFAADEDRDYYAMFFGNNNDRNRFDFPQGKGPFEKVMTFLSCIANGGTEFDGVLTEALEKASKMFDATGKGKADIVFITDGLAHLTDEWITQFNAERERVGVRVYSVYIGGAYDMSNRTGPTGILGRISDVVIPIKELKPESVRHIFEKV
jgi:uncharacterized protein with von Willebrand factor type A (vWA) domain